VTEGKRISFKDETKLGLLTSDDEAAAVERRASSAAAGPRPPDFHFICEVQRCSSHPSLNKRALYSGVIYNSYLASTYSEPSAQTSTCSLERC